MVPELVNLGRSYTMWPFNLRSAGNLTGSSNRWVAVVNYYFYPLINYKISLKIA